MNPHDKYKSNAINTSSKDQKIIMIFDEIIKLLHKAKKSIENNDFEGKNRSLRIAADALYTMKDSIDIDNGGETAKFFDSFCSAITNKIEFVNIGTEAPSELDGIINGIATVRELFNIERKAEE